MPPDKCFHLAAQFGCVNSHLFPLLHFRFSSEPCASVANTTPEYNENKIHTKIGRTVDRPQRIRKPNPRSITPNPMAKQKSSIDVWNNISTAKEMEQLPRLSKVPMAWFLNFPSCLMGWVPTSNYTQLSSRRWWHSDWTPVHSGVYEWVKRGTKIVAETLVHCN